MYPRMSSMKPFKLGASDFEADRTKAEGMLLGLRFSSQYPNILATATTDGVAMIWEVFRNEEKARMIFQEKIGEHIWSFCWDSSGRSLFVSDAATKQIIQIENGHQRVAIRNAHETPVHSLQFWERESMLITASYDKQVCLWDLRDPGKPVGTMWTGQSGSCSLGNNMLVVIEDNNQYLNVYDLREIRFNRKPDFVKFQARTQGQIVKSAVSKKDNKVSVCSVQGEVQCFAFNLEARARPVEYYERETNDTGFYLDTPHKKGGHDTTYYQVNDVLFHPDKDYFTLSGGSDGIVNVLNSSAKKEVKKFDCSDSWPVVALAINNTCDLMAVALGNDYHLGWEGRDKFQPAHLIMKKINEHSFRAPSAYGSPSYGSSGYSSQGYGYSRGLYY